MADYDTFKRAAIRGQDEIVVCPYNPSHHINKSRMQYHLVKCKKQHVTQELETCPFNSTHRVPKPEFQYHVMECPDKRIIETHKYQTQDDMPNFDQKFVYTPPELPPSEENWDNEDLTTYKPEVHTSTKPVLRNLQGATKSERKKFRQEERKRVTQLSSDTSQPTSWQTEEVPLRPPRTLPAAMRSFEGDPRLGMGRGLQQSPDAERNEDYTRFGKEPRVGKIGRGTLR